MPDSSLSKVVGRHESCRTIEACFLSPESFNSPWEGGSKDGTKWLALTGNLPAIPFSHLPHCSLFPAGLGAENERLSHPKGSSPTINLSRKDQGKEVFQESNRSGPHTIAARMSLSAVGFGRRWATASWLQ